MTTTPRPGSLLLTPEETIICADLAREAVRHVAVHGKPKPRVLELLRELEDASRLAHSFAGNRGATGAEGAQAQATARGQHQIGFAGNRGAGALDVPTASWATVSDAAERLKMSEQYVRRLCHAGELVAERRGPAWVINPDSLTDYSLRRAAR